MKRTIRRGVFETNSSTSHSLVVMKQDDFDKWDNHHYCYNPYNYKWEIEHEYLDPTFRPIEKKIYSRDEVVQFLLHNSSIEPKDLTFDEDNDYSFDELARDCYFYTKDMFDDDLEIDEETFTADDGSKYIVHCAYGYR